MAWSSLVPHETLGYDGLRYAKALQSAGFKEARVQDATPQCWDAYLNKLDEFLKKR